MSQRGRQATQRTKASTTATKRTPQRASSLKVSRAGDQFEREAERIADAVTDKAAPQGIAFSFASVPISNVQRDGADKPPSDDEKYKEAAKKVGEAFLETEVGKDISAKAKSLGESFIATLPDKIIAGAAAIGAVSALAAAHQPLPAQIPAISLDKIAPGLKVKITYEGPVDKPTKAMITFSGTFGESGAKKHKQTKSEKFKAETAKIAADQAKFRAGMSYPPGSKEDREQKAEADAMRHAAERKFVGPGAGETVKPSPGLSAPPSPAGLQLQVPKLSLRFQRPTLLGGDLKLQPPAFKLKGEEEGKSATEPKPDEEKKKDEPLMRKAAGNSVLVGAPPIVDDVLASPGQPLDPTTQELMERRFGYDFSQVRIHTDARAAQSARAVSAHAYTVGDDIVFDGGQYAPHALDGQRLLAHELAHVVQQSAAQGKTAPTQLSRAANTPNAKEALRVALNGDDDDVRDLTKHAGWSVLSLTPTEAALLIIHLLDGATLDDDEIAGLKILNKMLAEAHFDDTLQELENKSRFGQLMDDYHGDEYHDLLKLLSANIKRLNLKAHYLDEFIAMWSWFVTEPERLAIVELLERCSLDELGKLLTQQDRLSELRNAVSPHILFIRLGTQSISIRYEKIAAKVDEAHQQDIASALKRIFDVKAKSAVAGKQRTQDEIDRLLKLAASDLVREVVEYRARIQQALGKAQPDLGEIEKMNKDFEKRLNELLKQKSAEFDLELKYNVEFDRLLFDPKRHGRSWTADDLKDIDKILATIPPEILHANPDFQKFLRAEEDPKLAGEASHAGGITLFGAMSRHNVAHELGHIISYDNADKLLNDFKRAFKWEALTAADLTRLIPDADDRRSLQKELDDDIKKGDENDRHREGDFYYRYNRYAGKNDPPYFRYPKDACFISDYAKTDPNDDFADSFAEYITDPDHLRKACQDKFDFMHTKVFVEYLLGKQVERVRDAFNKEAVQGVQQIYANYGLRREVSDRYVDKLRDAIKGEMTTLQKETLKQATEGKLKPLPLKGTEASKVAESYLERLRDLMALANLVSARLKQFAQELEIDRAMVDKKLEKAHETFSARLSRELTLELLTLLDPHAQKILKGQRVQLKAWPELDALAAKYEQARKVMESYLPRVARTLEGEFKDAAMPSPYGTEDEEVGPFAAKLLKKFPAGDPRRQKIKDFVLTRRAQLGKAAEQLQVTLAQQAAMGVKFQKAQSDDPDTLVKAYKRDVEQFIKQQGKVQRAVADAARDSAADVSAAPPLVDAVVQSAGEALTAALRTEMEQRIGYDFSAVRIHDDLRAAQSARAVNALAYTVGPHVVFGAGQYAPERAQGRRLLAHELTHVAQQTGTALNSPVQSQVDEQADDAPRVEAPTIESELIQLPEAEDTARETEGEAETPTSGTPSASTSPAPTTQSAVSPEMENSPVAAQRADATSPAGSHAIVPRGHPSEQEADAVGRWLETDRERPKIRRYGRSDLAPRIARANGAGAKATGGPKRLDLVFLMGTDKNPKNPFYKNAKLYFKANVHSDALIDDNSHRTLASVFAYLRGLDPKTQVVGNLYLVSHANEDGTLSFPLTDSPEDTKVGKLGFGRLKTALKDSPELFKLPAGLIDRDTVIHIKGCNIGRSKAMLDKLDEAFGGKGKVTAPTHKQVYGTESEGKKRKTYEALEVYFIEHPGLVKLTVKQQYEEFRAKYTYLSEGTWKKIFPKKGADRQVVSVSYTYRNAAGEDEARASAERWGQDNLPRPEMYVWRVAKRKGKTFSLVAEKTNYVIDRILVDDNLKRLAPDESNPDFFGKSTFRFPREPIKPGALTTPELLQRISDVSAEMKTLSAEHADERREMEAEVEQMRAELKKRNVAIDVHVIKTEDWLGADEVYIKLGGAREPIQTPQHDLNDGQSHTFLIPLAQLLPMSKPYRVQVYDADWPDADDLIVDMNWASPYAPTQNTQSFDKANYKVTIRFER